MKIGILTLHYTCNYGGILQCLALQNFLIERGYEVELIRYIPTERPGVLRRIIMLISTFSSLHDIYGFIHDQLCILRAKLEKRKKKSSSGLLNKCNDFIAKHLNYTFAVNEHTIGYLAPQYDAIIVGSDQVWTGLGQKHLIFLFDWEPIYKGLKISYAACSANSHIPRLAADKIERRLREFDALSVRDRNTYNLVKHTTEITPSIVVDPTFLYDFQEIVGSRIINGSYIFCYILGGEIQGGHSQVIAEIKKKYGNIPIIAIALPDYSLEAKKIADQVIVNASPQTWINLLTYSDFVYTDSFHGCVFSMKYQKNFLAYYTYAQRTSRLIDLKQRYGLEAVIVNSTKEMVAKESIKNGVNYLKVNPLIEKYKRESINFLKGSLLNPS